MSGLSLLQLIPILLGVTIATFTVLKCGSRIKNERLLLFLNVISITLVSFSYLGAYLASDDHVVLMMGSLLLINILLNYTTILFLIFRLLSIRSILLKLAILSLSSIIIIIILIIPNIFLEVDPERIRLLGTLYPLVIMLLGYKIFSIYIAFIIILTLILLVRIIIKERTIRRKKVAKIIIFAMMGPGVMTFIFGGIIWSLFSISFPPAIMSFFLLFSPLLLSFAVLKSDFPNISPQSASDNILATMNDYVFVIDNNRKIVFVNKAAEDVFGENKFELIGKLFSSVFRYKLENRGILKIRENKISVSVKKKDVIKGGKKIGEAIIMRNMEKMDLMIDRLKIVFDKIKMQKERIEKYNYIAITREKEMIDLKKKIRNLKFKEAELLKR